MLDFLDPSVRALIALLALGCLLWCIRDHRKEKTEHAARQQRIDAAAKRAHERRLAAFTDAGYSGQDLLGWDSILPPHVEGTNVVELPDRRRLPR